MKESMEERIKELEYKVLKLESIVNALSGSIILVEDMATCEIEIMSMIEVREKLINLMNDDEDYNPSEEENEKDLQKIYFANVNELSMKLECYGYLIR